MDNLIINIVIGSLLAIIPYLIKYKKKYHLIAGYTDNKKVEDVQKIINISNSMLLFSSLIIVFSIINYAFGVDKKLLNHHFIRLSGGIIIIISLSISYVAYLLFDLRSKIKQ